MPVVCLVHHQAEFPWITPSWIGVKDDHSTSDGQVERPGVITSCVQTLCHEGHHVLGIKADQLRNLLADNNVFAFMIKYKLDVLVASCCRWNHRNSDDDLTLISQVRREYYHVEVVSDQANAVRLRIE